MAAPASCFQRHLHIHMLRAYCYALEYKKYHANCPTYSVRITLEKSVGSRILAQALDSSALQKNSRLTYG